MVKIEKNTHLKTLSCIILIGLMVMFNLVFISATVTTTLNSPADNLNNSLNGVTFNCSASTDLNVGYLTNISLFTNSTGSWVNNQTTIINQTYTNATEMIATSTIPLMKKNITIPNAIVLNYTNIMWIVAGGEASSAYLTFNYLNGTSKNSSVKAGGGGDNPTMFIFVNPIASGVVSSIELWLYSSSNTANPVYYAHESSDVVTYTLSQSTQTFSLTIPSYTLWNCYACDNSSTCAYAGANRTVGFDTTFNSISYNSTGYETGTESYILNITPTGYTPTNAKLVYNGTTYDATITSSGGTHNISKTLQIPSSLIGTNTFYYTWNISSTVSEQSITYTQTVSPIQLGLCNATLTVPYINHTFKDESNSSFIKATIPSSTFTYYLGDGTYTKTLLYSNATANEYYAFCFTPANTPVNINYSLQYAGSLYPQRIYSSAVTSYSNATTNKILYLLGSASGLYVTYQVVDGSETPVSGVYVNASRDISGVTTVVGEGYTGTDGGLTLWLNPDYLHTVKFSKSGYDDYTISHYPTQTLYTIQIAGLSNPSTDYTEGIEQWITPNAFTLENDTVYNFSARIISTYWTITNWGYNLKNSTGFYYYNTSSTSNGGLLQQNINTSLNDTFIMEFYYKINGTYTNYTYIWHIEKLSGDGWSIKVFANDLKSYLGSGMFGLTNFGLGLILFFVIILTTGIFSYKFGISSPIVITGIVFGIVFILDFGLGLMDSLNPINAVSHTPTIFVFLVWIVLGIREVMSNQ